MDWTYEAAEAWYLRNGENSSLKALLANGHSTLTERMLRKEVPGTLLLSAANEKAAEAKLAARAVPERPETDATKALQGEWRELYKQCSYWQQRLAELEQGARKEKALWILNTFDQIGEIWEQLEHYNATGSLRAKTVVATIGYEEWDKTDLYKELLRVRSRLSKASTEEKKNKLLADKEQIETVLKTA